MKSVWIVLFLIGQTALVVSSLWSALRLEFIEACAFATLASVLRLERILESKESADE